MLCCETDAWNMWKMKLVKPQTKCRRHMLVRARKKYDQCIVEAVQVCFCVFNIFSDMLRMLQTAMPEKWNVTIKSQTMQWVVHAGANKRKWPTGHGRCADLFIVFFALSSDMFRVLVVNQCSSEQREMRRETLWQALHEKDAETNAWIQNLHEVVHAKIWEWETLPNPTHVECTWHAVAWCCFEETAC